jgi:pantetheine-phosphate adenylyltransferase
MAHTIALLTGSMSPFTKGHKHVVDMSLAVFDKVVVGIGINPDKDESTELFSRDQKIRMARESLSEHTNRVSVEFFTGAAVDFANDIEATAIVRGIRNDMDHAYESSMSHANHLMMEIEHEKTVPTFYVPCPPSLIEVSSSRVRELVGLGRSIEVLRHYVLGPVADVIEKEIYNKR